MLAPGDRIWKIRPILNALCEKFRLFFRPFQNVCIDESLLLFRGRVVFRQYIPSKRARFGIKFFVICDCKTGYCLDMIVYTGTDVDVPKTDLGFSGSVVKKLMEKYFGGNHMLYTDNYYTSPALSQYLLEHETGSCGTVRINRKNYPKFHGAQSKGTVRLQSHEKMLAIRWMDNKPVHMLSTIHTGSLSDTSKIDRATNEPIQKPDAVQDYNINMRLVDKSDMQIGEIECVRKTVKWYKKVFLHLLDICMLNAYNIYRVHRKNDSTRATSLREFSHRVIAQILAIYGSPKDKSFLSRTPTPTPLQVPDSPVGGEPIRLSNADGFELHKMEENPGRKRRRCVVCTVLQKGQVRSMYQCRRCKVTLCSYSCFYIYHTDRNLPFEEEEIE